MFSVCMSVGAALPILVVPGGLLGPGLHLVLLGLALDVVSGVLFLAGGSLMLLGLVATAFLISRASFQVLG